MAAKRRQFTREFKLEAVRLINESGRSLAEVASELGIRRDIMQRWKSEWDAGSPEEAFPGHGQLSSTEAEVRRLRRELEDVKQERDFLKKAAAYFAKEQRGSTP
jgi:transposase